MARRTHPGDDSWRDDEDEPRGDGIEDRELPDEADMDDDPDGPDTGDCPHCGKEVYANADWCPHCGQNVTADELQGSRISTWVWATATILLCVALLYILIRGAWL